jgi:integrase
MIHWESMRERVVEYLNTRRRLGYQLKVVGKELFRFAHFADNIGNRPVLTTELAVAWASTSPSQINRARRLEMIRGFAKYCALYEPETQIPPRGLLGPAHRRITPYIYTAQEIFDLMQAASRLKPAKGLRPLTFQYLIGLLSATGLRISEALRLSCDDVDFENKLLVIKETKFSKSRYVPMHPTTVEALKNYVRFRDRLVPEAPFCKSFFLLDNGFSLNYRQALYAFQSIRGQLEWSGKRLPRLHDLRYPNLNKIQTFFKDL